MLKTIIISDIHIGKPDAQPQKLLAFLEKNPCENLIIN
jgi:UDP-2,3-diacylglucosamine pyrophosphatase LpxH